LNALPLLVLMHAADATVTNDFRIPAMARKFKREAERNQSKGHSSAVRILEWDEGGPPQAWVGIEITHRRAGGFPSMPIHAPLRAVIEYGDPAKS